MKTQTVHISGIICSACTKLITKKISKLEGVIEVNLVDSSGIFEVISDVTIGRDQIAIALANTDYKVL